MKNREPMNPEESSHVKDPSTQQDDKKHKKSKVSKKIDYEREEEHGEAVWGDPSKFKSVVRKMGKGIQQMAPK